MTLHILGSKGSMGRRYSAILQWLNIPFVGVDVGDAWDPDDVSMAIIATPTETHRELVERLAPNQIPMLCEKPISKSLNDVARVCDIGNLVTMVNQYRFLDDPLNDGSTLYAYYNHGRDGLAFDCINILGVARGEVTLREDSPHWLCRLNGRPLELGDMDGAYIKMVNHWLRNPCGGNSEYAWAAHCKAVLMEAKWARGS